jgi:hypothetical protein
MYIIVKMVFNKTYSKTLHITHLVLLVYHLSNHRYHMSFILSSARTKDDRSDVINYEGNVKEGQHALFTSF